VDRIHLESGCDTLIQGEVRSDGGIYALNARQYAV